MERQTILPAKEALKDIYLIAKLLSVKTELAGMKLSEQEVINAIVEQLTEVPYIPFPVSLHTVDVAPYRIVGNEIQILMGRKPQNKEFQFIGGFMDPGEVSKKSTDRELDEETDNTLRPFVTGDKEFVDELFINDRRYVDSCHKVTTTFYAVEVTGGDDTITGGDDIEEVKWFTLTDLRHAYNALVRPIHHELLFSLVDKLINRVRS